MACLNVAEVRPCGFRVQGPKTPNTKASERVSKESSWSLIIFVSEYGPAPSHSAKYWDPALRDPSTTVPRA